MQNKKHRTRPHIQLRMIVMMAVSNLKFKRFRSFVTILGVVIGIGSIFLLISLGLGLQKLVQNEIIGNQSINTVDITSANSTIIALSPENLKQIKSIEHVTDVSGIYMLASQVTLDGSSVDLVAYGIDSLYLELSNLNLQAGRPLDTSKSDELVINSSLLEAVGIKDIKTAINKQININFSPEGEGSIDKKMRIVGVIDSGAGSEIFVSQKVFQQSNVVTFTQAKAVIDDRSSIADARHSIEGLGYETTSPVDTLDQINEVFRFFNLVLVGLGSIGMAIAVLGMLNTLTVSLLERTREIALMMAIGARPKDVRRLFTAEAIILSLTGGIFGMLLASGLGYAINLVLNQFAKDRGVVDGFSIFSTPPYLIISTLVFMVLIGVVVSFVPARRASRINPIEALRQE
ncbi:ABC transporter permease [Candidatus Saccharibacteria bacterium]|nr:ABC transporter permease [Candidatus Saccharibacteria bacterium]